MSDTHTGYADPNFAPFVGDFAGPGDCIVWTLVTQELLRDSELDPERLVASYLRRECEKILCRSVAPGELKVSAVASDYSKMVADLRLTLQRKDVLKMLRYRNLEFRVGVVRRSSG